MSVVRVREDRFARTRTLACARNSGAPPRYPDRMALSDAGAPPDDELLFPPHQAYPPEPDPVDEASEASFPASDSPSTWSREE